MGADIPACEGHPRRPESTAGTDGPGGGAADQGGGAWKLLRRFYVGKVVSLGDNTAPRSRRRCPMAGTCGPGWRSARSISPWEIASPGRCGSQGCRRGRPLADRIRGAGKPICPVCPWKALPAGKGCSRGSEGRSQWFQKAAEQGDQYAQYFVERMDHRDLFPVVQSAARLLHHLAGIFREQSQPPHPRGLRLTVDKKLCGRSGKKKIAMGHKPDDHEEPTITM